MNANRNIYVCPHCDVGVYLRCEGDANWCDCGNVVLVCGAEPKHDEHTTIHGVYLSQHDSDLECDYDSGSDRFGKIRNAKKVVARLEAGIKSTPAPRRGFEEDVTDLMSLEN